MKDYVRKQRRRETYRHSQASAFRIAASRDGSMRRCIFAVSKMHFRSEKKRFRCEKEGFFDFCEAGRDAASKRAINKMRESMKSGTSVPPLGQRRSQPAAKPTLGVNIRTAA